MRKSEKELQQIRDQRYEEISQAALKIFARKGFAGAKISDITSSINLSHGLLYHYFQSKEEIYVSIIMDTLQQFQQAVEEADMREGSAYDKLNWFTALTFSGSAQVALDRHLVMIESIQADFLEEEIKESIKKKYYESIEKIAKIISEGQEDGTFIEGNPMDLAAYYISISQGLTLWNAKGFYTISVSAESVMRPLLIHP